MWIRMSIVGLDQTSVLLDSLKTFNATITVTYNI